MRSSDPEAEVGRGPHPHPKLEWRSHRPPAWCVCVWVWVGSHTNWTGVVGCACPIYDTAKARRPQTYAEPYLTIFAFGSDHFGSTFVAFGQLGDQGRRASTRFWEVWELGARFFISSGSSGTRAGGLALGFGRFGSLERVFSSVRVARGPGQAG